MNSSLSDRIKSTLTMSQVAEHYGFPVGRANFISCPFHRGDRSPSLRIYDRDFHCFGCSAHGTVIDFVMRLFNLPFPAACVRLNADFSLGLTSDRPDPAALARMRAERAERERAGKEARDEYERHSGEFRRLWAAMRDKGPSDPAEPINPEYAEACHKLPYLEWWFENNCYPR